MNIILNINFGAKTTSLKKYGSNPQGAYGLVAEMDS